MSESTELVPGRNGGRIAAPFKKGQSGNPSGLRKDGVSPRVIAIENEFRRRLEDPRSVQRLVNNWLKFANKGSFPHLEAILKRTFPVIEDAQGSSKVVFEGIRLEVANNSVHLELEKGVASFALSGASESQRGSTAEQLHSQQQLNSPEGVPSEECVPNPEGIEDREIPREVEAEVRESVTLETPGSEMSLRLGRGVGREGPVKDLPEALSPGVSGEQ